MVYDFPEITTLYKNRLAPLRPRALTGEKGRGDEGDDLA